MFEEVPIVIKNSHLISVLMWDLEDKSTVTDKHELLSLSSRSDQNSLSAVCLMDTLAVNVSRGNPGASAIWINRFQQVYLWEPTTKNMMALWDFPSSTNQHKRPSNAKATASSQAVDLLPYVLGDWGFSFKYVGKDCVSLNIVHFECLMIKQNAQRSWIESANFSMNVYVNRFHAVLCVIMCTWQHLKAW